MLFLNHQGMPSKDVIGQMLLWFSDFFEINIGMILKQLTSALFVHIIIKRKTFIM